jgi:hypothetical protein
VRRVGGRVPGLSGQPAAGDDASRRCLREWLGPGAADGKTMRGAVRPDGSQVHLLSVFDVTGGHARAQREVDSKTNEIPEPEHVTAGLDLTGTVLTLDALHTPSETARRITEDEHGHYLMIIKGDQPSLPDAVRTALAGPDSGFAAPSRTRRTPRTSAGSGAASAPPPQLAPAGRTPRRSCGSDSD